MSHKCIYNIVKLALTNKLVLATDASVNEGHAANAFCFSSGDKARVIFSSGSKVEGPTKTLTSYRAEMVSIITAVTLIDMILSTFGIIDKNITLYTDSETSITTSINPRLNTLHYVISNDIGRDPIESYYNDCRQRISLKHVLGHQDKEKKFHELEVPSQLNVLMDALSKKVVEDTINSTNNVITFPAQKLYLVSNQPIIHDIYNTLVTLEMRTDVIKYYEKHHDIPPIESSQNLDY